MNAVIGIVEKVFLSVSYAMSAAALLGVLSKWVHPAACGCAALLFSAFAGFFSLAPCPWRRHLRGMFDTTAGWRGRDRREEALGRWYAVECIWACVDIVFLAMNFMCFYLLFPRCRPTNAFDVFVAAVAGFVFSFLLVFAAGFKVMSRCIYHGRRNRHARFYAAMTFLLIPAGPFVAVKTMRWLRGGGARPQTGNHEQASAARKKASCKPSPSAKHFVFGWTATCLFLDAMILVQLLNAGNPAVWLTERRKAKLCGMAAAAMAGEPVDMTSDGGRVPATARIAEEDGRRFVLFEFPVFYREWARYRCDGTNVVFAGKGDSFGRGAE